MSLSPFYGFSGQEVQGWLPARVGVAESVESMNSVGAACREGVRIRCPVEEQNGKDREHVCRRVCAGRVSGILAYPSQAWHQYLTVLPRLPVMEAGE